MSTEVRPGELKKPSPNNVLIAKRQELGWGRDRVARELARIGAKNGLAVPGIEAIAKALYRHETGRTKVIDQLYVELYCLLYKSTPHDLFGDLVPTSSTQTGFGTRSHKFIPLFVGSEAVRALVSELNAEPVANGWFECFRTEAVVSGLQCELYLWPFGVAMFRLTEELTFSGLAQLAVWRRQSYRENLRSATDRIEELCGRSPQSSPYALSLYWLHSPPWTGVELETAARILCTPRVLLERRDHTGDDPLAHAELVERSLLQEGFDHPETLPFGVKGIALGYASWAGVVFCPLAPRRALLESEVVACELAVQSIWSYCDYIRNEVENGKDPVVPVEYGWRFLRGVKSRLTTARPHESAQHCSMRDAILQTSGLPKHLAQAVETLREAEG